MNAKILNIFQKAVKINRNVSTKIIFFANLPFLTLFNALSQKIKIWGKVAKENNGAVVVTLNNGKRAIVTMKKDKVTVYWGQLKAVKDIDISIYKDACEEDDPKDISYGYLNDLFSDEVAADTTEADTAVVD